MRNILLIAMLALIATPAFAKTWTIDYPKSHIGFTGTQSGEKFEGGFKNFTATIDFDPAHPENGKITASIDIAGITAGSADRDTYLPQSDWFNLAKFPKAEFVSTSIAKDPSCKKPNPNDECGDNFIAQGMLSIKGATQPITLHFSMMPFGDGEIRAKGSTTIMRNDFGIGSGQWANEDTVKNAVTVTVDIAAK